MILPLGIGWNHTCSENDIDDQLAESEQLAFAGKQADTKLLVLERFRHQDTPGDI
jgi:hypothetical protein